MRHDLENLLDAFKGYHPVISRDPLLSHRIGTSLNWPETLPKSGRLLPIQGTGENDETADSYFLVQDHSLQQFVNLLPAWSEVFHRCSGAPLCARESSVLMARMTAVLLSLQQPQAVLAAKGEGNGNLGFLAVKDVLLVVGRFVSALATRLIHGLQFEHRKCACKLSLDPDEVLGSRSAPRSECVPCSNLAEGITAIVIQILRLHTLLSESMRSPSGKLCFCV